MQTSIYFFIMSRSFLLRMRNVSDKSCRENQNTHFVFPNFFFRKSYRTRDNTVERGRPHMTIWCTRIARWILKATNTNLGCVILIDFPLQQC